MHHEFTYSVSYNASYAHPVEHNFVLFPAFIVGPMLLGSKMHIWTLHHWGYIALFDSADIHCGYEFPWSLTGALPFGGGALYHDYHHSANVGNYASYFTLWDSFFNDNKSYFTNKGSDEIKAAIK